VSGVPGDPLTPWRPRIEAALERCLPGEQRPPQRLHSAMRYAVFSGGKRLRPLLALAAASCAGSDPEAALPGACAVELVHTYSLIHDDLPALDNDDLRRGRPTLHRAYGEALAILAGDALLTLAFETLAGGSVEPARRIEAQASLARAIGTSGMIGGQVDDLDPRGPGAPAERVESIHRRKTAALMGASARIGALLGGAPEADARALAEFGERLGLAFQIVDDLLDETGRAEEVGKAVGKDRSSGKLTYPAVWGVEASLRRAHEVAAEARLLLRPYGDRAVALRVIAEHAVERGR
jgi:geranylgeranyl diphosphate synthase type II